MKLIESYFICFLRKLRHAVLQIVLLYSAMSFAPTLAEATHLNGVDITYEYVDSAKYKFIYKFYRNCRGVSLNPSSVNPAIRCVSTANSKALQLKLESIQDITEVCSSDSLRCSPTNTISGQGIEMHIYTCTVDFNDTAYDRFVKCGKVLIEVDACCRSNGITTAGSNTRMYSYAMLDLNDAEGNSSPKFGAPPLSSALCCNTPVYHYFDVQKQDAQDSVSYHLSPALSSYNSPINYYAPYSYKNPFRIYDPNNSGLVNTKTNPPVGFFFDDKKGGVIFTPTKCDEVTTLVYSIKEWRKDSSGTYRHIGTIRREMLYWVSRCSDNNPPTFSGPFEYDVCQGDSISFKIKTSDVVFKLPPPQQTPPADTVNLHWKHLFSDAKLEIEDSNAREKTAIFSWKAKSQNGQNTRYDFTVYADDDKCNKKITMSRTYSVNVYVPPEGDINSEDLGCGKYFISGENFKNVQNVQWTVRDLDGTLIRDTAIVKFLSTNNNFSKFGNDTLYIRTNKEVQLNLELIYGACSVQVLDTLKRKELHYPLFSSHETLLCDGATVKLYPDLSDTSKLTDFQWSGNASDTTALIRVNKSGIYRLKVVTPDLCNVTEQINISTGDAVTIESIPTDSFCTDVNLELNADSFAHKGGLQTSYRWDDQSNSKIRKIDSAGEYYLSARNACGVDTMYFSVYEGLIERLAPRLNSIPSDSFCSDVVVELDAKQFIGKSYGFEIEYEWENGDTSTTREINKGDNYYLIARSACGLDTSFFKIYEGYIDRLGPEISPIQSDTLCLPFQKVIDARDYTDTKGRSVSYVWQDNLANPQRTFTGVGDFQLKAFNACGIDSTSFSIVVDLPPELEPVENDTLCEGESIEVELKDIRDLGIVERIYMWMDNNESNPREIQSPGKYKVVVEGLCGSDSISFTVRSLRKPIIDLGNDTMIALPFQYVLIADTIQADYLWNTGDRTSEITASDTGVFGVVATNSCGMASDSIWIQSTLGFRTEQSNTVTFTPNPFDEHLEIHLKNSEKNVVVTFFDALGREIQSEQFDGNYLLCEMDVTSGIYFVQLKLAEGQIIRMVVKK